MKENQKKAFDFAADFTKQLITLSTAIITLSATFSKAIIGGTDNFNRIILLISWILFIFSIIGGVLTLMALTGNLDPIQTKSKNNENRTQPKPILTIYSPNVTITSRFQVIMFLSALALTCWCGYSVTSKPTNQNTHKNYYMIIRETKLVADSTIYKDTLYLPKK